MTVMAGDDEHWSAVSLPNIVEIESSWSRPLVIACCSAAKSAAAIIRLGPESGETMATVTSQWRTILTAAKPDRPARLLYTGRAFAITCAAAARTGADLAVVSAGLGLVLAGTHVPAYDLTTEYGPCALARRVVDWDARAWWRAVRNGPFAVPLAREAEVRPTIFMALTRPYARLLGDELEALAGHADRVRIFGGGLSTVLPEAARPCLMPYDNRLEAVGLRGTRGDFAARALADFLDHVGIGASSSEDAARVRARLAPVFPPSRPINLRADDATLAREIGTMRQREPGISTSQILRRLRDEVRLACSEARLRRLMAVA